MAHSESNNYIGGPADAPDTLLRSRGGGRRQGHRPRAFGRRIDHWPAGPRRRAPTDHGRAGDRRRCVPPIPIASSRWRRWRSSIRTSRPILEATSPGCSRSIRSPVEVGGRPVSRSAMHRRARPPAWQTRHQAVASRPRRGGNLHQRWRVGAKRCHRSQSHWPQFRPSPQPPHSR